jgi:hypothetical protein
MRTKIWNGLTRVVRFCDRAFIYYMRFCVGVWVGVWLVGSLHAGRLLSFAEVMVVIDPR